MKYALGIDIGGTKIEASLISSQGDVIRTVREPVIKNYEALFDLILQIIAELKGSEKLEGIGFSIPGSLDPKSKKLRNAPNSPEINQTDFFLKLENTLSLPTKFENDANCLTLSESQFGVAKNYKNVIGIIMGTGIGGGVLLNGKLLNSPRGLAPELGHTIVNIHGRSCLCGNQGCVEAYLSGPSILKRYHEAGGNQKVSDTKILFELKNDLIAKKTLEETKFIFCRFMASLVSMYDPEIIVLGGGLSLQDMYYQCENEIADFIFGSNEVPLIKKAAFGDASGKLGAAALFF